MFSKPRKSPLARRPVTIPGRTVDSGAESVNWSKVEELLPYGGVRIEDEVHCTDAAPENLTRDAFAALT